MAGRVKPSRQIRYGFLIMGSVSIVNLVLNLLFVPQAWWALLPIALYSFGWAMMVPVVTLLVLDIVPERRGMASSFQAFIGSSANGARRRRDRAAGHAFDDRARGDVAGDDEHRRVRVALGPAAAGSAQLRRGAGRARIEVVTSHTFDTPASLDFDIAPYRLSGTVLGVLVNHRAALAALGDAVDRPPYKAAPKGVVLYVKPRNTLIEPGRPIEVEAAAGAVVEAGAALGIVIGRATCKVAEDRALEHVAGYVIVGDFSVPHASFFRPAIRFRARDASCAIGPEVIDARRVARPDELGVRVFVDGRRVHETSTGGTIRGVARLVADVSDFMTLAPGDVLLAGVAPGAPTVAAGSSVAIEIDGLGRLEVRTAVAGSGA